MCLDGAALTAATLSAEVERLREALTGILRVAYKGSAAASFARAALAGTPSETRREQDRALAERVRERIAEHLTLGYERDAAAIVRAINLDAMLEES